MSSWKTSVGKWSSRILSCFTSFQRTLNNLCWNFSCIASHRSEGSSKLDGFLLSASFGDGLAPHGPSVLMASWPHSPGNKLAQKGNADSGVQFIYTGGPKAESPLSWGPRSALVKIFYTPCVCVQTHHPNSLETYINKGRVNTTTITPSFTCYVFKQLIINKPAVTFQTVNNQ